MKILIVSDMSANALANSFVRACKKSGYNIQTFDLPAVEKKYTRLGKVGVKIHAFWPVNTWQKKANRELAIVYKNFLPDIVLVVGSVPVLFGTLAFFKSIGNSRIVLYWPDTLLNLNSIQKEGASLYDSVATYSSTSIIPLKLAGFRDAFFLPFAGDTEFLGDANFLNDFEYDLSFAGGFRPEREAALATIIAAFPKLKILIKGTEWGRFCKNKTLLKYCEPKPVYGKDFGDLIRRSRINLNVIDDTNYPAANMRFFEVPAAGGLQLSSACPEMEPYFTNLQNILYYKNEDEMLDQINWVLHHPDDANRIRHAAFEKISIEHNYVTRMDALVKKFL